MKRERSRFTRRRFLEHTGAIVGAATLGACGSEGDAQSPGSGSREGGAPSTAVVGVVANADVDAAVARAVELAGGIDAILPGQTVFIKPNAVSTRAIGSGGIRTSPEVLAAVVRLVKQKNPGRIIVGDRSARAFPDTALVFESTGLGAAALAAGADEIYAAQSPADAPDEWVLMQPPFYAETWSAAGGILAMRRILEADHLINVPVCKDHRYALFSMSMKNFIGAIGDSSRDPLHFASSTAGDFSRISRDIAILNQLYSPLIDILDATTALISGGPEGSNADAVRVTPGLVLASADRVALDSAGVSLIKLELGRTDVPVHDPAYDVLRATAAWELPQIRSAIELGLGVPNAQAVTLAFEAVADAAELESIFRA